MKTIVHDALTIIETIETAKLPVRVFLLQYALYFQNISRRSLIPPECREHDSKSEASFVFVIGSYLFQRFEQKPVTWMERRRFVKFPHYSKLYNRTLCSDPRRRFQHISELKSILTELMQDENADRKRHSDPII